MALIRRTLSDGQKRLLRRVADAGRPTQIADLPRIGGESDLDVLLERELLRELSRGGKIITVEVTARGLAELALDEW